MTTLLDSTVVRDYETLKWARKMTRGPVLTTFPGHLYFSSSLSFFMTLIVNKKTDSNTNKFLLIEIQKNLV
jgi:hypothetical protein